MVSVGHYLICADAVWNKFRGDGTEFRPLGAQRDCLSALVSDGAGSDLPLLMAAPRH